MAVAQGKEAGAVHTSEGHEPIRAEARDIPAMPAQRSDIHDDDNPRTIGPLDMHGPSRISVTWPHRTLNRTMLMWQKTTVWTVHLEGSAQPFIGIPRRRCAAGVTQRILKISHNTYCI